MNKKDIEIMDKDMLSDEETLLQVFSEPDEFKRQVLINAMVERAKELKCTRQIQALIKAFHTELKKAVRQDRECRMTDFGYPHADEMQCGNWVANNGGVSILTMLGEMIACYHPILPVERLRNLETKTEKIKIAFKRNHKWEEIVVDKELIASASKIVALSRHGVAVTSENAKWLVRFLADLENFNDLPVHNSTSKLGWIGQDFIPYDHAATFDAEARYGELIDSVRECGSYEMWLECARGIRKNKEHYEPQIYLAASFASVLVKPLNMLPFIVNLWGSTGKGKTVALMLAASIWGNPAEGKYITDSYATQNAFEARLDMLNNLPLLMDDLSKVRDKLRDNFADLVYLMCSGKGKGRSNVSLGLNKTSTWSNTILSNMERPLATESMRGGAINRILDFAMADGYIFKNGNKVVELVKDNYGHAGKVFVDLIREIGIAQIAEIRRDFEAQIKDEAEQQNSVKEEKQILPLSIILTADKLATEHIFKDDIYLDLPTCVSQLKGADEVSEYTRGYEYITNFVMMHPNEFDADGLGEYKGAAYGFIKDGYAYINTNVFRDVAEKGNFSVKAFCHEAKAAGTLKTNDGKHFAAYVKGKGRFYTILLDQDSAEGSDFRPINEQIDLELPFD